MSYQHKPVNLIDHHEEWCKKYSTYILLAIHMAWKIKALNEDEPDLFENAHMKKLANFANQFQNTFYSDFIPSPLPAPRKEQRHV